MSQKKSIDYLLVKETCNEILKIGEKISVRAIHARIGGSYSTISTFYRQWREAENAEQTKGLTVSEQLNKALNEELTAISAKCYKRFEGQLAAEKQQQQEYEKLLSETENLNDELKLKFEQLEQKMLHTSMQYEKQLSDLSARLEIKTNECIAQSSEILTLQERCHQQQVTIAVLHDKFEIKQEIA